MLLISEIYFRILPADTRHDARLARAIKNALRWLQHHRTRDPGLRLSSMLRAKTTNRQSRCRQRSIGPFASTLRE